MNGRHLAALLLVPALALTACGGDGGDPEPAASEQTLSQTPSAAPSGASGDDRDGAPGGGGGATPALPSAVPSKVVNAFVACMREQGVKVPEDVGNWRPDPQDGRTQKALMACIGRSGAPNPPGS